MHEEQQYAVRAIKAGAAGYLTKESASDQLVAAIRKVAAGGAYISAEVAEQLALGAMADASGPRTRRFPIANTRCSSCWSAAKVDHRHRRPPEPVGQDGQHAQDAHHAKNEHGQPFRTDPLRDQQPSRRRSRPVLLRRH